MNSTNPRPPRWADWLLEKLLHGEALEEVQGDLHESFLWRLEDRGKRHAKWQFVLEILQSIRFSNLKPYPMIQQLMTLFTSYIKTGWRFIIKSKGYAAINILGLSIGMVFSWFAYQYSVDQYTYDQHIDEAENLYNMIMAQGYLGTSVYSSGGSSEAAHRIVDQIPEVVDVALFAEEERILNLNGNTVAQKVFWNNATLANLLNLKILEGKQGTFDQPDQVIISERMALKLGVRGEALDHTLKLFDSARFNTYQIIGVYQNLPSNSTINPDIMLPLDEFLENKPDRKSDFGNGDLSILLKFKETSVMAIVNEKVNRLFEAEGEGNFFADISPFSAYHLGSSVSSTNGFAPKGDKEFIGFIAISGLLCLLISIINYANLSVSIHINRSREVAVRKVMGAARMGIFLQLMIEAFLSTMLAVIVALIIYHLASPTFSDLVEKTFDLSTLLESRFIPGVVGLILMISLISGFYPAMILARFDIVKSLKGIQKARKGKAVMQSLLVVQFSISTAMIICMFIFHRQLNFILNADHGQNIEEVVLLNTPDEVAPKTTRLFFNKIQSLKEIKASTTSLDVAVMPYQGEKHAFPTLRHTVDEKHFDLFEIPIKEGRGFKAEEARDHIIVNEAFIKSAEIEDPIGKTVNLQGLSFTRGTIIGVSKNTVFFSSKLSTIPTIYFPGDSKASIFAINVKSSAPEQELIAAIEPVWEECFYPYPLKYKYLDDSFLEAVKKERKIAKISSIGSGIGIFLAIFGLLGLVSINIKEKLKRVSISRVLGASSLHIAAMISNRFIIPIALSLTLGISMGVYISLHWLENYPFRISLEWYHLTIASFLILGLAGAIIWSQLRMALNKNPVIYLKED